MRRRSCTRKAAPINNPGTTKRPGLPGVRADRRHRDQVDVVRAAGATSRERSETSSLPHGADGSLPRHPSCEDIDAVVAGLRSRGAELVGELSWSVRA